MIRCKSGILYNRLAAPGLGLFGILGVIAILWPRGSPPNDPANTVRHSILINDVRIRELGIVLLDVTHPDGVTSVPAEAVLADRSGTFVYVEDFDLKNSFLRTTVSVMPSADDRTRVIQGLFPGDHIVVKGSGRLRNEPSLKSKPPDTTCS